LVSQSLPQKVDREKAAQTSGVSKPGLNSITGGAQYVCGSLDQGFDGRVLNKSCPRNKIFKYIRFLKPTKI
jgi:hypothetical protein